MGQITSNPSISLRENIGAPLIYYFADGAALFGCIGNPEGVITANKRSIAVSDNGNVYIKTTDTLATGWTAIGGGGGAGTVTSVGLGGNAIFDFSASTANPIVGAGTFSIDFASQSANRVFASPSGAAGVPTFRVLTSADLALAAALPANGVQYNDGTNAFAASNGFKFDPASNTVQVGESTVLKGTLQLFAALSAGSVKHTVNNPASNYVWIWGDSLPANNDLLRASVSGNNVTIASIAASALGFATINATDGVIPYRSSATAFSDSQFVRTSSIITTLNAGQLIFPIGSGSAPSIAPSGATNYGIYFAGSNSVTFSMGGTATASILAGRQSFISGAQIGFTASASDPTANNDIAFARRQAGYVRVTNGSTGIGGLLVGGSTATPVGQTHLINGATGIIPLFIESIAATSVAAIKAEISSIQSFAFYPSGKLQGGCNIPTSNQQFSAIGNLKSDVSEIGNSGGTNTNALSFTVPANSIANNGDTVEFITTVVFAANANNKQVDCQFAGTSVFLITSAAYGSSQGQIRVRIKRTSATTAKVIGTLVMSDTLLKSDCQYTDSLAVTWSNSNTFQVKLQGVSNSDIINKELESNVIIAQTS